MTENLFDVLGVLTAFVTVMLIFSIAITSLVQATQGLFRWRARNLQNGLAKILKSVQHSGSTDEPKKNAISLLNKSDASLISTLFQPEGRFGPTGMAARFFGPQLSWMDPDELDRELRKNELNLDDGQIASVSEKFRHSQTSMRKVFLRRVRIATILWAFVIAFYYQLSTPQLLHDFSTDTELRDQAEQTGRRLLEQPDEAAAQQPPATDKQTDSVDVVPQQVAAPDQIPADTESPVDKQESPAYFQLAPWRHGWGFYYESTTDQSEPRTLGSGGGAKDDFKVSRIEWNNLIGVLITVLLLSLGAPFWFDMLKSVVNLKDTLAKHTDSPDESGKTERSPFVDDRIALLKERLLATDNPVLKASLQKEINDLRLVKAENL